MLYPKRDFRRLKSFFSVLKWVFRDGKQGLSERRLSCYITTKQIEDIFMKNNPPK